jgi:iron complex transport system ATP-binding protein
MVLHDVNNAARYSHQILALSDGRIYDAGPPDKVVP